jgi:HEPN domain-containing protein
VTARLADTRGWLRKAKEDLQAARRLLKTPPALSNAAAFHCQQAAEKHSSLVIATDLHKAIGARVPAKAKP